MVDAEMAALQLKIPFNATPLTFEKCLQQFTCKPSITATV